MNLHLIMGRLGRDPELRYTKAGTAVCNLSVATDGWDGKERTTEWHRVTAWGKTAENIEKHFAKGDGISLQGEVRTRKWEDKDGGDRYSTETHVFRFEFPPGGKRDQQGGDPLGGGPTGGDMPAPDDDDIPF